MKKSRHFFRNWVILIFLSVMAFAGIKFYQDYLLSPKDPSDTAQRSFVIPKGEATINVARRLEKVGLIRSANAFTILARSQSNHTKVQAGDFRLSPAMSPEEILKALSVGRTDKAVTIIEGWRVEEIAAELNKELGIKNEDFLKVSKEGHMFPDTYSFDPETNAGIIADIMRSNFNQKFDNNLRAKIISRGLNEDQGIILASIVEREARSFEARKMVASILLKRLKIGMGLNADATIQYAKVSKGTKNPPVEGWWERNLTEKDLKIDSLYNTYIHQGLPPAPISNPSLSSLQAVASADLKTPYLYYYHDSKGNSYYARTLEEHNQNVSRYP